MRTRHIRQIRNGIRYGHSLASVVQHGDMPRSIAMRFLRAYPTDRTTLEMHAARRTFARALRKAEGW